MTSFNKVMAAVHQTPAGVHALRAAALVADAAGAELIALSIVRDPWQSIRPEEVSTLRPAIAPSGVAEERGVAELQQVVTATIGTSRATPMVRFGNPGTELARWARLESADLLILGRQPLGQFERRPAGLTLQETLRSAALPCLCVPFGQRTWTHVLGVLGSERDAAVSEIATAFAALWHEQPTLTRFPAGAVASDDPNEGGLKGSVVNEVLRLVRDKEHNALVVDAAAAEVLVERAPCAVLTVPVSTV